MEKESIDDFQMPERKQSNVTKNVLVGMSIVLAISVITGIIIASGPGMYAVLGGLFAGFVTFPALTIVLAIGFFIAKKKKEGGVTLLVGFVFLLFGFIVCSGFL
jgi:hypothetical protein